MPNCGLVFSGTARPSLSPHLSAAHLPCPVRALHTALGFLAMDAAVVFRKVIQEQQDILTARINSLVIFPTSA